MRSEVPTLDEQISFGDVEIAEL